MRQLVHLVKDTIMWSLGVALLGHTNLDFYWWAAISCFVAVFIYVPEKE